MPVAISGDVIATASHWTADGSRIVTEATVHTPDGDVVVSQLGGTVDGLTMRQFPSAEPLRVGMAVALAAHDAPDASGRMHTVVDDVKLLAAPNFVRTGPTKSGHYLFWESGCIFTTLDTGGTKAVPFDTVQSVVSASIETWNSDTASCSYLVVKEDAPAAKEVGKDGVNVIKFRDVSWCRPMIGDDPMRCYNDQAAGITTAVFVDDPGNSRDGAIVDADIEINNVDFAVSVNDQTTNANGCHAELQNTLTHELGHLHGLEHTCTVPTDPPRVDGDGNPVPMCTDSGVPQSVVDATMYPFQNCGETKKETLEDDDITAICTIYPVANDPHDCSHADFSGGGCTCDVSGGPAPLLSFSLAGGTFLWLRRRRRVS
jgi:hypothetical protein